MYKVLIVDDEKPVRQAIELSGNWGDLHIGERMEASNGFEALELVKEYHPDIILLDIKMPVMDGIEFMKSAQAVAPKARFIIISGFDEFQYAQQAIEFNAIGYLLKPVIKKELNLALHKAVRALNNERQKVESELVGRKLENLTVPLLKEKLFTTLIESTGNHPPILADYKALSRAGEPNMLYGVAIFSMLNFQNICLNRFQGDLFSAYFSITNVLNELSHSWSRGFSFKHNKNKHEAILVLEIPSSQEAEVKRMSTEHLTIMTCKLEELFNLYSVVALGGFYHQVEDLYASFREAEIILNSVNILQEGQTVFTECELDGSQVGVDNVGIGNAGEGKINGGKFTLLDKREKLLRAVKSGSVEYVQDVLEEFFQIIQLAGYFSIEDARRSAKEFMMTMESILQQLDIRVKDVEVIKSDSINRNTEEGAGAGDWKEDHSRIGEDGGHLSPHYRRGELTLPIGSLQDLRSFTFEVIGKVMALVQRQQHVADKLDVYEIKDFIERNYDKEIKLKYFSEKYFLSKEYLSKLFKEEFQYGIYEYLLKVRMEKAKRMLDDTSVQIQQVSERLGYNDNHYFSKAFKKYFGISPSEYRAKLSQQ